RVQHLRGILDGDIHFPLEDLDRDRAWRRMVMQPAALQHRDQDNPYCIRLDQDFGPAKRTGVRIGRELLHDRTEVKCAVDLVVIAKLILDHTVSPCEDGHAYANSRAAQSIWCRTCPA